MKQTTTLIYNLITAEKFQVTIKGLKKNVQVRQWTTPIRNEYSLDELLEDLPNLINIIKQICEDGILDKLHISQRQAIHDTLSTMNPIITNIDAGHQQLANLMDSTSQLLNQVRTYRLDFGVQNIPRYTQKIKEYNDLSLKLELLILHIADSNIERERYKQLTSEFQEILEVLKEKKDKAEHTENLIDNKLQSISEFYNKSNTLFKLINTVKESVSQELVESKTSQSNIKSIEIELKQFYNEMNNHQDKMAESSIKIQEDISNYKKETESILDKLSQNTNDLIINFSDKTDSIITKNETQTEEIDKQLGKAVGVNLFKSFEARRKSLNKNLNKCLNALALRLVALLSISFWIYFELVKGNVDIYMFMFKILMALPFIFVIGFIASRYTKERRLIEEYAFKSIFP
ncbi:MAG: hypothetical protein COA30_02315 [Sulfurimonas sp.]|nr:MAG: hypothetical protein COA30_02315 [Sulfurimonas sp.]